MTVSAACKTAKRSIVSTLRATWVDHDTGAFSVPHFASIVSLGVLSVAFMKNVYLGKVDGLDYIYYAVAMAASASPSLMYKLMALKFPTVEQKETK